MRNPVAILVVATAITLTSASDAFAAGRISRFAALRQLRSPFNTIQFSRYSSSTLGLPVFVEETEPTVVTTEPVVVEPIVPAAITTTLPPVRPRLRSPYRPPPRPSFP